MKYFIPMVAAFVVLLPFCLPGQDQGNPSAATQPFVNQTAFTKVDQGPNHNAWGRVQTVTNIITREVRTTTNVSYLEMATGLNYHDSNGQWAEASETIDITAEGGQAVRGQAKVTFLQNINSDLTRYTTSDGKNLNFHVLGLGYQDASGKSVLFAQLQDSTGVLLPSGNQVFYTNAFDGASAGVRYTYTKSGFEQDILIQGSLPDCRDWDLDPQTTMLQVLTEFVGSPEPEITVHQNKDGSSAQHLNFGAVQIDKGKAFSIGSTDTPVMVRPNWVHLQDPNSNTTRTFLLEQVSLPDLQAQLANLPGGGGGGGQASLSPLRGSSGRSLASIGFHPPPLKLGVKTKGPLQIAKADFKETGLVLDFTTLTSGFTNYTFTNGTYYINGTLAMSGTTTFEDGAILKYSTNSSLVVADVTWLGTPYHPVVLTSKDDDSLGEVITGSTSTPTNLLANPALKIASPVSNIAIANFRITHAQTALSFYFAPSYLTNGQIFHCGYGVLADDVGGIEFDNVLWAGVATNLSAIIAADTFLLINNTFSSNSVIAAQNNDEFYFTNCIFANVTALHTGVGPAFFTGNHNGFYNCTTFGASTLTSGGYPFQTVGNAGFYLAHNSPFLNIGTTSVGLNTLADLRTLTTFPPVVFSNVIFSASVNLSPQAQRDPGLTGLTLGYHYPPIDYAVGGLFLTNCVLTVAPGTVLGGFGWGTVGTRYSLAVHNGSQFVSSGYADNLARFVSVNCVQEASTTNWPEPIPYGLFLGNEGATTLPTVCRFTDFSIMGGDFPFYYDVGSVYHAPMFRDCQFHGGTFQAFQSGVNLTNCLLDHVSGTLWNIYGGGPYYLFNNLFRACNLDYYMNETTCAAQDNLFDHTFIYDEGSAAFVGGYNAYVTNWLTMALTNVALTNITLSVTNSHDKFLTGTPNYQTGALGNRYLPASGTGSTMLNAGSTTADTLGLYHYTTQTNGVKETTSVVDIGFHYVGTTGGVPTDTSGKGLADYLQDLNGNGVVQSGDMNWLDPYDWGFRVVITHPKNNSPLP